MKNIFKLLFLFNVSVLFAGGPCKIFEIANLTGEDIYFTVVYNSKNKEGFIDYLENKRNKLSPNDNRPIPFDTILRVTSEYEYIKSAINNQIIELNIYNNNGEIIFNIEDILNSDLNFVKDDIWDEYADVPGEFDWCGSYYFNVTKANLRKTNRTPFSHQTTRRLNLIEYDNISAPVIRTLNERANITVLQTGNIHEKIPYKYSSYWVKVRTSDGSIGWCPSMYLKPY